MAERIPIFITPARKSNFAVANFELKIIAPLILIAGIVPILLIFEPGDTGKIAAATIIPGGGSTFYLLAAMESIKLLFGNQSLKTQFQRRSGLFVTLLVIILFGYSHLHPHHFSYFSTPVYQKSLIYRPFYFIAIPIFLIVILLIRTIPMTIRFYKLKRQKQLAV